LLRQNFISADIGLNKAEVLSNRYNGLYQNITVSYLPKFGYYSDYDEFAYENPADLNRDLDLFIDIKDIGIDNTSHVMNLVDNEGFKKALDLYISANSEAFNWNNYYFSAGVNLFNGQVYYNRLGRDYYTIDHADIFSDFEEVQIESCAEVDARGTDDNPEQMFSGNDIAASLLANLFQCVLTEIVTHKKVTFISGSNMSASRTLDDYRTVQEIIRTHLAGEDVSAAQAYVARYGSTGTTTKALQHYQVLNSVANYTSCV
jgi:hypothetical protein